MVSPRRKPPAPSYVEEIHPALFAAAALAFASLAALGVQNAIETPDYFSCFNLVVVTSITAKWYTLFWLAVQARRDP